MLRAAFCLLLAGCLAVDARESTAQVRLFIVDAQTGSPLSCRIHLQDANGSSLHGGSLPFWRDHFVCPGEVTLQLATGEYRFRIERGPEYQVDTGRISIAADTLAQSITNRLTRLTDLSKEGWWSGELHIHRPVADIELLMGAEDLHVAPVITWWNDVNTWSRQGLPAKLLTEFDNDRFYHLMAGEDERNGGALLYFQLQKPLPLAGSKREFPSPMTFVHQARDFPGAWIDIEKPFWYDTPVWLASGLVDSVGIANNHMQRGGMLTNEAWGRPRDQERFPDPKGNGFWTQEIYYHILNSGLRLPPTAGSASGVLPNPVGYNRMYVHLHAPLTYEGWWSGLRTGRVFVSNGPLLRCRANGEFPGHVFTSPSGQSFKASPQINLDSRDPISTIEIIKNGRVERAVSFTDWKRTGTLGEITFDQSGWFLVRAFADVSHTFRFASTGPYFVEVGEQPRRISKASAQFFLDWVRERIDKLKLDDPQQREAVLKFHRAAEEFWNEKVARANAE